jgi:outer membrane lipoprotein SlyB
MIKRCFVPIIALCFGLLMSGCASMTDWTPTVDPYNDPNAANIETDLVECKTLANKVTGGGVEEGVKYGAIGAGVGAAVGAVLGSLYGDAGSGAAMGAGMAGGVGAAGGGLHGEMTYKQAYINCVAMRGHRIIDP